MLHRSRTGAALAAALLAAAAALPALPAGAQPRPAATASPRPTLSPPPRATAPPATNLPGPAPLATPLTSLPPASQPNSALPYPAYGSPAPGVDAGVPSAALPEVVTLEQAIAIGFARSPLLAQARASVEIANAPVDLAASAILPNISASASTSLNHREATGSSNNSSNSTTGTTTTTTSTGLGSGYTSNAATINLRQLIFDGGRVSAQLRSAKATQSASIAQYKRQLQTVAFSVANAYYAALSAQRQTQVANETVKINVVNESLVSAQIRAGTAARADLSTAQLPTAQARVAVVRAQGAELNAQAVFVNAMGLNANTLVLPQDDGNVLNGVNVVPAVVVPTYDTAIARALMLRPDYYAAQQNVESFRASLRAARLNNFPNVSAAGSYGLGSTSVGGGDFRNTGSIGLSISIPLFDQGITRAQVEQAQGQLDQSVATLALTEQSIQLNVKQALVNLVSARATFQQTQAELAKAREVLQSTQAQYRAGVTTLPLLLNAQVGLTQALSDQVTAVYSLRQAEAAFLYAEGANAPA